MNKSELLQWLQEEYQQWQAFFALIDPARMDQPGAAGDWSIKDIVTHLNWAQPRLISYIQAAQRGEPLPPPPWPEHLQTDDEINAWMYESNRGRSVREVLDQSHQLFQQLLAVIEGLPDEVQIEPARHLLLLDGQHFPAGEFFDHFHDHEPEMRDWLARIEKQ